MYRVALIDDDRWAIADIRKTFSFEDYGFTSVDEYSSAEAALETILNSPPDLIVSDIRMDNMSGLEFVRILREHHIHTIVIIVSGYSCFDYAQKALRENVFDYLLKPLDDTQVKNVMERVAANVPYREKESLPDDTFSQVKWYIDENYMQPLSLEKLANQFFLNRNYFSEMFSKKIGMPFSQYKNKVRVEHAKQMLIGKQSITDIAYAVGFNSASRFSKVFCQFEGISPQQFRLENREKNPKKT